MYGGSVDGEWWQVLNETTQYTGNQLWVLLNTCIHIQGFFHLFIFHFACLFVFYQLIDNYIELETPGLKLEYEWMS